MNTYTLSLPYRFLGIFLALTILGSCTKGGDSDEWVESRDVVILPYKSDPKDGKQYLDVIYENVGHDTYRKLKFQLITRTGEKLDTIEKTIIPETVFAPKDKRLNPRHIGQEEATFDEVKPGMVWVVLDKK
ncbi:MAG: hypothetical protein ABI778_11345 [Ignavibacteriota bacterium]